MEDDFTPKRSAPSLAAANLMEGDFSPRKKAANACLPFIMRPAGDEKFVVFASAQDGFEAHVLEEVLKIISAEMADAAPNETIGLLAGRVLRDDRGPYTLVLAAQGARKHEIEATPSHVGISADGHAQVRHRLETTAYGYDIVGWYHSHPRYPARFSPVDITEQSTFRDKNHVGIVVSGIDEHEPFGVYRGPQAVLLVAPKRVPIPRLLAQTVDRNADDLHALKPHIATDIPRAADAPMREAAQVFAAPPPAVLAGRLNRVLPWAVTITLLGVITYLLMLDARMRAVESLLKQIKVVDHGNAPATGAQQAAAAPPAQEEGTAGRQIPPGDAGGKTVSNDPSTEQKQSLLEGSAPRANPLIPSTPSLRRQKKQKQPSQARASRSTKGKRRDRQNSAPRSGKQPARG
jgi:proteasome lid subunit RPN8/RPN11